MDSAPATPQARPPLVETTQLVRTPSRATKDALEALLMMSEGTAEPSPKWPRAEGEWGAQLAVECPSSGGAAQRFPKSMDPISKLTLPPIDCQLVSDEFHTPIAYREPGHSVFDEMLGSVRVQQPWAMQSPSAAWPIQSWDPTGCPVAAIVQTLGLPVLDEGHLQDDAELHDDESSAQWSAAEDQITTEAVTRFGCKWHLISTLVPGRTAASVRNRWHRIRRATRSRDTVETTGAGVYKCSRCGQPKKGHQCALSPSDGALIQNARKMMDDLEKRSTPVAAPPPAPCSSCPP